MTYSRFLIPLVGGSRPLTAKRAKPNARRTGVYNGKRRVNVNRRWFVASCLALLSLMAGPGSAETIVGYEALNSSDASPVSDVLAGVTAIDLSRGEGLNSGSGTTYNSSGWNDEPTDFLEWGWASSPAIDLTDLDVRYDRSSSGPSSIDIQLSVNGGLFESIFTDADVSVDGEDALDIDLTAYTNVTSATFRLFGTGASSGGGTFDIESLSGVSPNRGIVVNGVAAVPEPDGLAMLVIAGVPGLYLVDRLRRMREPFPRAV